MTARELTVPGTYEITCGLLSNPRGTLTITATADTWAAGIEAQSEDLTTVTNAGDITATGTQQRLGDLDVLDGEMQCLELPMR